MEEILNNPVYQSLISGDQSLSFGTEKVKYFDEQVSPFVGIEEGYTKGFDDLYDLLPAGRKILFAAPYFVAEPKGWQLLQAVEGLQLVYQSNSHDNFNYQNLVALQQQHVTEMMALAALTKPGPFGLRTIDFGHYYGIFENEQLVAMTGQRLHVHSYSEISAVCTHPSALGKGYASTLVHHQLNLICQQQLTPFLHVRADNSRAIEIYKRLHFKIRGAMNFYFMQKQ